MTKHLVIYVPGIGDNEIGLQRLVLKFWRLAGIKVIFHSMPWESDETYKAKAGRLLEVIDQATANSNTVSLIGVSAGASAVINAYAQRGDKIDRVVYVCGKINETNGFKHPHFRDKPGFKESVQALAETLPKLTSADKAKMLSLFSPTDQTVVHQDTVIPGVRETALPRLGHGWAIFYVLTFGAPRIIKFIRAAS